MNAQDRSRLRPGFIEVLLCEKCGAWSHWHQPGGHPWHVRRCTTCGSERVSRCETMEDPELRRRKGR